MRRIIFVAGLVTGDVISCGSIVKTAKPFELSCYTGKHEHGLGLPMGWVGFGNTVTYKIFQSLVWFFRLNHQS
jgi:hypothetical protein